MINFISLSTIVEDLLLIIRGSSIVSTEPISKIQVENWVHQYRSLLLKRDLDKGKYPNPSYIQSINYLKLSKVDIAGEDNITPPSTGYYVFKSDLEIPTTVDLNFKSGLTYVGTPGGDEILFVPEERSKWQMYKKYTGNEAVAYLKNNYIYVIYGEPLEYISIRGIFNIPSEVGRFVNPETDQPYFNLDTSYPVPVNMIPTLKQMILKSELGIESTSPSDDVNDSQHVLTKGISKK